jgi:hypothetical protein
MGNVKYTQYQSHSATASETIMKYMKKFISDISLAFVVILLAIFLAPKFIEKINYALMKKPLVSAGIGILSIVLIPVLVLFLLFTGFLTSLSIVTAVLYGLILAISLSLFSLAIAKSLAEKWNMASKGKLILLSILSAVILWVAKLIPILGTYVSLFITVVGLGMFLYSIFRKNIN